MVCDSRACVGVWPCAGMNKAKIEETNRYSKAAEGFRFSITFEKPRIRRV